MADVIKKINDRMDHLQLLMEGQAHLDRPEYVLDVMDTITKFWSVMTEDDKEYVQIARSALEDRKPWTV